MRILLVLSILLFSLAGAPPVTAEESKPGRLSGVLAHKDGRPVSYGVIYLFDDLAGPPPVMEKYWRVPNEIFEVDADGRFDFELPAGTYYLAYIKHADPYDVGPPKTGETILISRDPQGQPIPYAVRAGELRDIGKLCEAVPYDPSIALTTGKEITAIEGRILGEDGKPIPGVPVFAFLTPAAIGRPLFTSERSDRDGVFLLRVDKGGRYYLKIRGNYGGGRPGEDSVMDGEKDEKLTAVSVQTGQIVKGVLYKALTQRGPKSKRKLLESDRTLPDIGSKTGP